MYYAVECQDYAYYPQAGDPTARLHAWVDDAIKAGVPSLRLSSTYFGDAPCLWWPNTPTTDPRVPALVDEPFPTFVLTATLDPATPFADAMRIYGRLTDAYMFVQRGGPHVIFGRGPVLPGRRDHRLPRRRRPAGDADHGLRRGGRRRLRRQPAELRGRLPDREPVRDLDRGHAPQLRRLQLPVRLGPARPGLRRRGRPDVPRRLGRDAGRIRPLRLHPEPGDHGQRAHRR